MASHFKVFDRKKLNVLSRVNKTLIIERPFDYDAQKILDYSVSFVG